MLTDKYVKRWLGIPSRGANTAIVHIPQGLNIPRLSDMYWKAQSLAYTRSKLVANDTVKNALGSCLERESQWSTKQSTVAVCNNIYETLERRGDLVDTTWNSIKRKVNALIEDDVMRYWREKIQPLLIQGMFAELLILQN